MVISYHCDVALNVDVQLDVPDCFVPSNQIEPNAISPGAPRFAIGEAGRCDVSGSIESSTAAAGASGFSIGFTVPSGPSVQAANPSSDKAIHICGIKRINIPPRTA